MNGEEPTQDGEDRMRTTLRVTGEELDDWKRSRKFVDEFEMEKVLL